MKVIKNFTGGLSTTLNPANIRDDEFAQLTNMFCQRGSLRPKSGNKAIGALTIESSSTNYVTLNSTGGGSFNVLTGTPASAYVSSQLLLLSDGVNSYSQSSSLDGTLITSGTASGTINYITGVITITGGTPNGVVSGSVSICLGLPVMGIANWVSGVTYTPIIWDTTYSYTYNPTGTIALPYNSTFTSSGNTCSWNGQDYNLFSYSSFADSLWCTNTVPCMQFKSITGITLGSQTTITITNHGLVVNDYVWLNEIVGPTALNGQTAQVVSIVNTDQVRLSISSTGYPAYVSGGIAQYLTSNAPYPTKDGLRYFYNSGWVNYAPPINSFTSGSSLAVEYICGCKCMLNSKGRLCLFGVYVATSAQAALGDYTLLPSTMFYSSIFGINFGSPYYTSLNPIGAVNAGAFYPYPAGVYGGSIDFGTNQPILGAIDWKLDYVFVTFPTYKIRLFSTSSAVTPFAYTRISSQYGGCNATSSVALDAAVFDLSSGGFVASTATNVKRFDEDILDLYLSVSTQNEGLSRVCSYNEASLECMLFTFPSLANSSYQNKFPDTSLLYNYRNGTWALIDSHFTCYGLLPNSYVSFYGQDIITYTKLWSQYTLPFNTQNVGTGNTYRAAGNQCGYVFDLGDDAGFQNDISLPIAGINGSTFTIYNHNLSVGKVLRITNCAGVTGVNDGFYAVEAVLSSSEIVLSITGNSGTYVGLGVATVVDNFIVKTKEFNDGLENGSGICIGNAWLQLQTGSSEGSSFTVAAYADTSLSTSSFGSSTSKYVPIYLPAMSSSSDSEDGYNDDQINQTQVWKQVVVNSTGSSVSLVMTRLITQILQSNTMPGPISINEIILKITPTSRLVN
jgi:hypothetical protein